MVQRSTRYRAHRPLPFPRRPHPCRRCPWYPESRSITLDSPLSAASSTLQQGWRSTHLHAWAFVPTRAAATLHVAVVRSPGHPSHHLRFPPSRLVPSQGSAMRTLSTFILAFIPSRCQAAAYTPASQSVCPHFRHSACSGSSPLFSIHSTSQWLLSHTLYVYCYCRRRRYGRTDSRGLSSVSTTLAQSSTRTHDMLIYLVARVRHSPAS